MVLAWYFSSQDRTAERSGEVELTTEVLDEFQANLERHAITLDFYSGPWDALQDVGAFDRPGSRGNIVLTSETIYSIESLSVLVDTMQRASFASIEEALQRTTLGSATYEELGRRDETCLVAAKVLYFGVGGGVSALKEELKRRKASSKTVWQSHRGVARVVLQVQWR